MDSSKIKYTRPLVDIPTFLKDPYYLGATCANTYPHLVTALEQLFSGNYQEAVFADDRATGKSYFAAIAMCRILYELSCMESPHRELGLSQDSIIALVCMDSGVAARTCSLPAITAKVDASPYFREHYLPFFTWSDLRFPNRVCVIAKSYGDHSVLGLNIYSTWFENPSAVDTERYYHTIRRRMQSRFGNFGGKGGKLVTPAPFTDAVKGLTMFGW